MVRQWDDLGLCFSLQHRNTWRKNICLAFAAVYALGFYVDKKEAKKVLGPKFRGKGAEALSKNQEFCNGNSFTWRQLCYVCPTRAA